MAVRDIRATLPTAPSVPWPQPWPRSGVSAIVFRAREVLLVERGSGALKGRWSLPGGHIEAGERARAAALREVREETGVAAEIAGLVDVHEVILRTARAGCRRTTSGGVLGPLAG